MVNANQTISVLGDSSVGPYDGGDDTLVGILNNSNSPVSAITVSGPGSDLSGFDGDGICTYSFAGSSYCNAQQKAGNDPYDYEGPDNTFVTSAAQPDSAEVDFNSRGLAVGASTYFSLEGALVAAKITARKGHLQSLNISTEVTNAPMPVDPSKSVNVKLVTTVTNENGIPATGASVKANGPVPFQATGIADARGETSFLLPVSTTPASTTVVATLHKESASTNVDLYSSTLEGVCQYNGTPSSLDGLSQILDMLLPEGEFPQYVEDFAEWISFVSAGTHFLRDPKQTTVEGYEISGPHIKNIYALYVEVDNARTGTLVSSSTLYSHEKALIALTTGEGGGTPLQQIQQRLNCGGPPA